ncbi:MptD family putative ECF transporter S component [Devriesea agamarum]|uniref:MptD family putative ECF transporter S component n=1 Tax=Devriesea agamarum TaxID=472569 RepID=UPI00071C340D|nr:MptD family putative ECF transporter S component [Devriesea agamarum]
MKFTAKELISLGIFTAVYTVIYLLFNSIGAIAPVLQLVGAIIAVLLNGITYMLFLTRVHHFGLITLMALLLGILVTLGGHPPISILTALVAGLIADVIAARGGFRAAWATVVSYGVFCLWVIGAFLPLLFMREEVLGEYRRQMGDEWANAFTSLFSTPVIIGMLVAMVVVGMIGGLIGRRALSKHFERAGLA